jgi:hypothetical protein
MKLEWILNPFQASHEYVGRSFFWLRLLRLADSQDTLDAAG